MNAPTTSAEYYCELEATWSPQHLDDVVATLQQLDARRHAPLIAIDPTCYACPLNVAIALYRQKPAQYLYLLQSAVGSVHSDQYCRNMATVAAVAYDLDDRPALGRLALQFELAILTLVPAPEQSAADTDEVDSVHPTVAIMRPLVHSWQQALTRLAHSTHREAYVEVALAYFSAFPRWAAPPIDLLGDDHVPSDAPGSATDWPLLRVLAAQHAALWQQHPTALDTLAALPHALLSRLAQPLRNAASAATASPANLKDHLEVNPFAPISDEQQSAARFAELNDEPLTLAESEGPPPVAPPRRKRLRNRRAWYWRLIDMINSWRGRV